MISTPDCSGLNNVATLCAFRPTNTTIFSLGSSCNSCSRYGHPAAISSVVAGWILLPEPMYQGTIFHVTVRERYNPSYTWANDRIEDPFHYWWQAHALDVLIDGLERTGDSFYGMRIHEFVHGIIVSNKGSIINNYYDDMLWMALALLRAHNLLGSNASLVCRASWTRAFVKANTGGVARKSMGAVPPV